MPVLAPPGSGRREALFVLAALCLCPPAAWLIGDDPSGAVGRGRAVAGGETALGLHPEPAIAAWLHGHGTVLALANVFYLGAHVPVAGWALIWTWYLRRDRFRRLRDTFLWLQLLLIATWIAVPTAPPPLVPGGGVRAGRWGDEVAHRLQSAWAAMPSGHVAFALVVGITFARLGDRAWLRWFGRAYPPLVVAVTVGTGNHLWLDAAGAGLVTAAAWWLSGRSLTAVRQAVRKFRPAVVPARRAVAQRVDANADAGLRQGRRAARDPA